MFHLRSYTRIVLHVLADATPMEQHWSQIPGAYLTLSASYWPYLHDLTVQGSALNGGSQEASRGSSQEALNGGSQEALNESNLLRVLVQESPRMGSHQVDRLQRLTMMLELQRPQVRLMCKPVHRQTSSLYQYSLSDWICWSASPGWLSSAWEEAAPKFCSQLILGFIFLLLAPQCIL